MTRAPRLPDAISTCLVRKICIAEKREVNILKRIQVTSRQKCSKMCTLQNLIIYVKIPLDALEVSIQIPRERFTELIQEVYKYKTECPFFVD